MKNAYKLLAALLASASASFASGPFLTIGDDVTVSLSLFAAARYEDNILLMADNEQDDFVFQFVPGVEVNFGAEGAPATLRFTFSEVINRYADHSEVDTDLANFNLEASYASARYKVYAKGSFNQYSTNSGIQTGGDPAGAVTRRDVTYGSIGGDYKINPKSSIALGFTYRDTHYKRLGYVDLTEYIVPVTFAYEISPKLDATFGIQYRRNDPDSSTAGTSDDITYSIGLRGELTPKLSGFANAGITTRYSNKWDNSTMMTFGAGVNYFYSAKTQFGLTAKNDFGSSASSGRDQKTISIALTGQTDFSINIRGTAKLAYYRTNFMHTGSRKDNYYDATLSLLYLFNESTSVALNYMLRKNDSNNGTFDYTANVGSISFSTKY